MANWKTIIKLINLLFTLFKDIVVALAEVFGCSDNAFYLPGTMYQFWFWTMSCNVSPFSRMQLVDKKFHQIENIQLMSVAAMPPKGYSDLLS